MCVFSRVRTQMADFQKLHSTMSSITWLRERLKRSTHVTIIRCAMIVLENCAWNDYEWCPSISLLLPVSQSTIKSTWRRDIRCKKYRLIEKFIQNTCTHTRSCIYLISKLCGRGAMHKIMQARASSFG